MTKQLTTKERAYLRHDWQQAATKAAQVTQQQVESRLLQQHELMQIIDRVDLLDQCRANCELDSYLNLHCNKSGQPIRRIDAKELMRSVTVHGIPRTIDLLAIQFCQQTATQWLPTDNEALLQLSIADPIGYWVYSAGLIIQPFTKQVTNQGTKQDNDFAELAALIDGFSSTKELPELHLSREQSFQQRIQAQQDRIAAHHGAIAISAHELIESNELMRRAIGLLSPAILNRELPVEFQSLAGIVESMAQWQQFNKWMQNSIENAIKKHASQKQTAICNADIANLKAQNKGWTSFATQTKLRGANSADSFAFDIRDFAVSEYQQVTQPKKIKPKLIISPTVVGALIKQTTIVQAKPTMAELLAKSKG